MYFMTTNVLPADALSQILRSSMEPKPWSRLLFINRLRFSENCSLGRFTLPNAASKNINLTLLLNASIHPAIKYCLNGFFQLAMKETSSKFETDENVLYPENLLKI